jgi:hypothetical protein
VIYGRRRRDEMAVFYSQLYLLILYISQSLIKDLRVKQRRLHRLYCDYLLSRQVPVLCVVQGIDNNLRLHRVLSYTFLFNLFLLTGWWYGLLTTLGDPIHIWGFLLCEVESASVVSEKSKRMIVLGLPLSSCHGDVSGLVFLVGLDNLASFSLER